MRFFSLVVGCVFSFATLSAVDSTFLDYQNYNHGYCPECSCYPCRCEGGACAPPSAPCNGSCPVPDPCNPAPVCGAQCGLSPCTLGVIVAGLAATGAIVIGSTGAHAHH